MKRKGVTTEGTVITLVIFGAVFIILFVVYKSLFSLGQSHFTDSECQSSLLLTKAVDAAQITCWVKVTNPIPIRCDRHFVSVNDKAVVIDGTDVTNLYSPACPSGGTDCLAQNVVAEQMRTCWKLFFEGEQVVLQQVETSGFSHLYSGNNYARACFVCSEITIPKQMDLLDYLKKTKMKTKDAPSYYDYLAKNNKAWCDKYLTTPEAPTCFEAISSKIDAGFVKRIFQATGDAEPNRLGSPLNDVKPGKYAIVFVRRGISACTTPGEKAETGYYKSNDASFLTNAIELVPVENISNACDVVVT